MASITAIFREEERTCSNNFTSCASDFAKIGRRREQVVFLDQQLVRIVQARGKLLKRRQRNMVVWVVTRLVVELVKRLIRELPLALLRVRNIADVERARESSGTQPSCGHSSAALPVAPTYAMNSTYSLGSLILSCSTENNIQNNIKNTHFRSARFLAVSAANCGTKIDCRHRIVL